MKSVTIALFLFSIFSIQHVHAIYTEDDLDHNNGQEAGLASGEERFPLTDSASPPTQAVPQCDSRCIEDQRVATIKSVLLPCIKSMTAPSIERAEKECISQVERTFGRENLSDAEIAKALVLAKAELRVQQARRANR